MLCPFTSRKKAWLEFSCRRRLGRVRGNRTDGKGQSSTLTAARSEQTREGDGVEGFK